MDYQTAEAEYSRGNTEPSTTETLCGKTNLSWNEVTEKCLKGVWKNIQPDLSKGGNTVDTNEIVELAKQTSLDEVNVEDVEEKAASLSNDELKELVDQRTQILKVVIFNSISKSQFDHYDRNYGLIY
ncbi:hypothetical protein TNIN_223721 [Trichonephila inaurata madagascariensis]|uniref:Uncharacterized protein n=1 Tax=Trichonephila inaurata madagascariensis TaxID=2747483 RepID=A0A8X7BYL3_9ARAC|nr:hypothetical protein TNIN_223721 [Trichonephila inaurata madagascariensis]